MSKEHSIFYNGKMLPVKNLIHLDGVNYIKNNKETLYNILLDTHNVMMVNNMLVETLHPNNLISKIYTDTNNLSIEEKSKFFKEASYQLLRHNVYSS